MQQRLGAVIGIVVAMLVGAFIIAAPSSAADSSGASVSSLQSKAKKDKKKAKKAQKKAKKSCKKAKKANGNNKKSAKKKCSKNRKKAKKAKKKSKKSQKKLANHNAQFFDVCKNGCKYKTVQAGANAAGKWQKQNKKSDATVRVQPGTYVEGVLLHGKDSRFDFDNLTIMGVKKNMKPNSNAKAAILEGTDAKTVVKGTPGWFQGDAETIPANNAIEGRSNVGLKLKNMWARNYQNNTFFVWASNVEADNERCADFVMDNLVSSDTRAYGLFSRNCFGGKFLNSEGWNHGDSTLYIGETPCDDSDWNNRSNSAPPCQKDPNWTIVKNVKSHQNSLGYSGTNSKYVKITESAFYNNGIGLVPNTLDSEKFEPNGWLIIENNNIFWNNYNYYSTNSTVETVIGNGNPIGIGVELYGSDGVVVRNNNIFGNEQWGAAAHSGPQAFGVNDDDDAKNLNNQFIGNNMGRDGLDPNGNADFFNDHSGGGNCWLDNTPGSVFAPGNESESLATIYPECQNPHQKVGFNSVTSLELFAGLQVNRTYLGPADGGTWPATEPWRDLTTIFGLAEVRPSELQECSWKISTPHPAFTDANGNTYTEERADPVPAQACTDLVNRPAPYNP
jgi:hypothetical protein